MNDFLRKSQSLDPSKIIRSIHKLLQDLTSDDWTHSFPNVRVLVEVRQVITTKKNIEIFSDGSASFGFVTV